MLNYLPTAQKIQRMNRRQRKKLRVGEFQELVFEIRVHFSRSLGCESYDLFLDDFIAFIESNDLVLGSVLYQLGMDETKAIVTGCGCNSPTEEDRQAILSWVKLRPEVSSAEAGDLVDAWYGWEEKS